MNNPALFGRWASYSMVVGVCAAVASLIGALFNRAQFFHSYLFAWLFWSGLSFGSLVVAMMQYLTGGQWGFVLRRLANAAFTTLPVIALLFLPVLLGVREIYEWASGGLGLTSAGFHHKQQWLNIPAFTVRALIYFALICTVAEFLRRWSLEELGYRDPRLSALSAGGLIVYALCINFASTDWVMSLDTEWYSTIFGVVFAAGQFLGALAFLTALLAWFSRDWGLPEKVFNDLGNMLLAFTVFWIYVSFAQFLIIWAGNLPKEISWYLQRSSGGWQWVAAVLVLGQFLIPFATLLSRAAKRNSQRLAAISLWIVLANVLNSFWLVAPSFHPGGFYVHWLDVSLFLGLGGIWLAFFFYFLKQRPPLATVSFERAPQ